MVKSKYGKLAVCALVIGGLLFLGWQRWQYAREYVSTDNAEVEGVIIPIRAKLSGTVVEVPIRENARVEQGELLYQVREDEYRRRVEQAQANYLGLMVAAGQGGMPGLMDSQVRSAAARSLAAEAAIAQLGANLEQARSDYQRTRRLASQGVVSTQDLEAAQARFNALNHELQAARSNSRAAVEGTLANKAALKVEEYRIGAAEAELELARIQLQDTRQTSPQAGIIAKKEVEPGQFVVAGQKLLSLVSTEHLWVIANFKETHIGRVRVGQKARISVDAFPGERFEGVVQSLVPATGARFSLLPQENATGNFTKVVQRIQARIELDQVPERYRNALSQGMSVFVEVNIRDAEQTL
ncbi:MULTISPECIES: HlyD family secretion protein [Pseudomonas]|uniref:HlyD family secretion protein n=1 Tax=Pseudomonas donghuensis TaxID=1163398 RepID=A0AAP0X8A2_9PSED|nr:MULTISPECIES: HlyD family secretion protein [Pseudomonas]MDF9894820.1 membrane fusion protein (multidrug efflux system) [Pseudomonas vranovensis]KDN97938.1 HlyD family secretion protein [Pseudomonas donghuensis]MBF4208457.1 HlyD family secretion protein [Pseudomonas donghuensis]MBS7597285.1 HlyD family secretion protein [Pseudomonas sp. RC2C2]MCP6692998.1 HlyD family secretion protein [Pseudomonas donghuensis]